MNKFSLFDEKCTPKIIGELYSQQVIICKFKDDFVWHIYEMKMNFLWFLKEPF